MNSSEERKPKKIAIFSLAYQPFVGGAEIAVKEITDRLPNRFFCLTGKFDYRWPEREKLGNVEVVRVGGTISNYYGHFWRKIGYIWQAWREAEKANKIAKFDAIWAIMAAYGGMAALLFKLRHPSVPLLLTLQEGDSEEHILRRVGIFYPLWKLIFKRANFVQAISQHLADLARRHGAKCPIEIVPNGVSVEAFSDERLAYSEKSKTLNPKRYTLITTSRLVYKNGIDTLIRAMAVIASALRCHCERSEAISHHCEIATSPSAPRNDGSKSSDIKLQILGSGPDEQKLKNLATELGIANKVEFLGHIEPEKIPEYLAQADIFVRASRSEGLGNSFLEAMAAGLPIIGTPVGGIVDFLKSYNTNPQMDTNATNETNGLFAKVDDPPDLAEKISILLKDEELCKRLGQNGRKLILRKYSWDGISSKMRIIFEKLSTFNLKLKTNLLLATGIYPPEIGGPATYSVLLEKELPQRGFSVRVLPFRVVRKLPKLIRHLAYFWKCFWILRRSDLIYAQDPVSVGLPAMLAAKILRKPFLMRVAGDYAWEQATQRFGLTDSIDDFQNRRYGFRTELLRKAQKFVANRARVIITPSKYFQKLVSGWVKNPGKVKAIYNGIELGTQNLELKTYNLKLIVSAGRLVPWKGFDVLIEIMKDLPDWKLVIVGDGPEREALELKVKSLKLEGRVKLIGQIPREELLKRLEAAGIFLLNTSFESFSFQVVEAMNAGTPVITTNIGNLSEIIDNNKEGILVSPNNKEQILAAIRKFSSDADFREQIIRNARAKAQLFSIEKTAEKLSELIKSVK